MKKALAVILLFIVTGLALVGCKEIDELDEDFKETFTGHYDYAYVLLPNGECIEGKVQNYKDFAYCDEVQVTIDDVTYLTNFSRVVLCYADTVGGKMRLSKDFPPLQGED